MSLDIEVISHGQLDERTCDSVADHEYQASKLDWSLTSEWLTTEEAARYLKVSIQSLRNLTSNGKVPYYKFESRNRYRLEELRKLLLKNPRGGFYGNEI